MTTRRRRGRDKRTSQPERGRPPTDLDAVVDYRRAPDGGAQVPVTLLERATETYRLGGFTADVAARCGVRVETVRVWETTGTAVLVALNDGSRRYGDLTPAERMAARFVTETTKAEVEGKVFLLGLAEQLSRGGAKRTVTTEKVVGNTVVERTTREETTLPDSGMIRWRLERRWPTEFGPRQALEVTGAGGGPVQIDVPASVASLYAELDRIRALDPTANGHAANGHEPAPTTG